MAARGRIRTVKPEYWDDEKLAPMDPIDRLVFLGLISYADDAGRLVDNVKAIDGFVFPATDHSVKKSLERLAANGRLRRYTAANGQKLIQITHWAKHQRVDKPAKNLLPPPEGDGTSSLLSPEGDGPPPIDANAPSAPRRTPSRGSRENGARSSRSDLGPGTVDRGAGAGAGTLDPGAPHTPRAVAREDEDDDPPADPPVDAPDPEAYPAWRAFVDAPPADGAKPHWELTATFFATLPTVEMRRALAALANKALQEGLTHGSLYDALWDWTVKRPGDPGPELWRRYLGRAWGSQKRARAEVARQSDRLRSATDADRAQFAEWERQAAEEAAQEAEREAAAVAAGEVTHG
jgi:hypothetical protein